MKQNYILILLSLILISCSDGDDNKSEKIVAKYAYSYFENKKIVLSSSDNSYLKYGLIEAGGNLVFEYRYTAEDNPAIADDEYAETILFEIQPNIQNFSYTDSELSSINIVFTKYCFCYFPKSNEKDKDPTGTISGKKLSNNQWEITMDITFYGDERKSFTERFILKQ